MRTLDERLPLLAVNSSHILLIFPLQAAVKAEISMGYWYTQELQSASEYSQAASTDTSTVLCGKRFHLR
jgi:hypothetical protein